MRLQEIDWREEIGIARRRLRDVGGATDLDAYKPDVYRYETRQVLAWANIGTLSSYEVPYVSPNALYASRKHAYNICSPSSRELRERFGGRLCAQPGGGKFPVSD